MQAKYRIFQRGQVYYSEDRVTGHQASLHTRSRAEADQIISAKNQAAAQPVLNVTMARAYLSASSPEMLTRTWSDVLREIEAGYLNSTPTLKRWRSFMRSEPVESLLEMALLESEGCHLLAAMRHSAAGVSTNVLLRIAHNRAMDLGWLLAPVLPRKLWPKIVYGNKRATTAKEHERILAAESLDDYRLYYELLWVTGGSQTDIADLHRDDIDHEATADKKAATAYQIADAMLKRRKFVEV